MPIVTLVLLALAFFATSVVGVVTGSNSLITVPLMFQAGIDEKTSIATNMFGLVFMAIGGTIPFLRQGSIEPSRLTPYVIVTIAGSALGAALVGLITNDVIRVIVIVAMIAIVLFTLLKRDKRAAVDALEADGIAAQTRSKVPYAVLFVTFVLAIYGGLYSGGYVTVLTAVLVAFSGMNFTESVAATKFINVFSSGIATLVFMWQGLVDYKLGAILAVTMFVGAFIGAHFATKMNEIWLRRIFLATVLLLAIKTLADWMFRS